MSNLAVELVSEWGAGGKEERTFVFEKPKYISERCTCQ